MSEIWSGRYKLLDLSCLKINPDLTDEINSSKRIGDVVPVDCRRGVHRET